MNSVLQNGRLTKNCEYSVSEGLHVCKFILAVDDGKDKEGNKKTEFIPMEILGKLSDSVHQYLVKGKEVIVRGKLHIKHYEDKNHNKKIFPVVSIDEITLLGSKTDDAAQESYFKNNVPGVHDNSNHIDDSDIPI